MAFQTSDEKIYRQCRDCIFYDEYADGQVTESLCQRKPLEHNVKFRSLSADIDSYATAVVPCPYKVSIDRVLEIVEERLRFY